MVIQVCLVAALLSVKHGRATARPSGERAVMQHSPHFMDDSAVWHAALCVSLRLSHSVETGVPRAVVAQDVCVTVPACCVALVRAGSTPDHGCCSWTHVHAICSVCKRDLGLHLLPLPLQLRWARELAALRSVLRPREACAGSLSNVCLCRPGVCVCVCVCACACAALMCACARALCAYRSSGRLTQCPVLTRCPCCTLA